jgi:hypothetical protein
MSVEHAFAREIDEIVDRARIRVAALEKDRKTPKQELKLARASFAKLEGWRNLLASDRGYERAQLPGFYGTGVANGSGVGP